MAEGDVEFGYVVDVTLGEPSGTELVADAAGGATTLTVDYAGDFEDSGEVVLNGTTLAYTSITYGDAEADPDVINLAAPLVASAVVDDKVVRVAGGEPVLDWMLHVSLGDGHPVDIPIPFEQRAMWLTVDTSTPVPVMVSSDLEGLTEVPGREPTSELNVGPAGTSRVSIRADYGPLDDPGILFEVAGDTSDFPPYITGGWRSGDIGNFITLSCGSFDRSTDPTPSFTIVRNPALGEPAHRFLDGTVRMEGLDVQGTLSADTFMAVGGDVGFGTFRDSVDARVSVVAPTVTMTTGGVGTGAFRDSVRAALNGNYAAPWTTYTPTFTAATTALTLGSFTRAGRYLQVGKRVNFSIVITATAASGYGTGTYEFGLPVAARAADEVVVTGAQTGPNHGYIGRSSGGSTSVITLMLTSTDAAINVTNSGMANGTVLRISGTYEAA